MIDEATWTSFERAVRATHIPLTSFDSLGLRLGRPSDMLVIMRVLIYESVPEVAQSFVGQGMLKTSVGELRH